MKSVTRWGLVAWLPVLSACTAIVDQFSGRDEACQILSIGTPAMARVVQLIDTGTTINQNPVVEFVLEVDPGKEAPFQARARALISRLDVPQIQPGTVLPVKYDPRQRTRVAIDLWDCSG